MSLSQIVNELIENTLNVSLGPFLPELVLCGTIVALLIVRLFDRLRWLNAVYITLAGAVVALFHAAPWTHLVTTTEPFPTAELFTGMLVYDQLSVFVRSLLLFSLVLVVLLSWLTGVPHRDDRTDVYTLLVGATLGMCLMASANHLLIVFLAVEMASVPSYVLAGMLKTRKKSSEAALKYAVFGAGAAGVMLYGISLLAGVLNSVHLPTMAAQLADKVAAGMGPDEYMVLGLGGLMLMVGLAFKLSAVPFHFWCPDVFEGATAEVNAFLSVASKAAALALLVRVAIGFGVVPTQDDVVLHTRSAPAAVADADSRGGGGLFNVADTAEEEPDNAATDQATAKKSDRLAALAPVRGFIAKLIAFLAIITCTFGNLAAYGQTNIKRLLAYSTIAHAGYMMMAVPPALALVGSSTGGAEAAIAALALYMAIYVFMNLGAFAVVAFFRNAMGSEEIADYGGLIYRCPGAVICLSLILFSLIGLPPLAGFLGKFAIFAALVDAYRATSGQYLMILLWVGGINTVISLFYYLRVVKVMTIDPEPEDRLPVTFSMVSLSGAYLALVTLPLIILIVNWNWLNEMSLAAARHLFS